MRHMTAKTTHTPSRQPIVLSDADREVLAALPADERELIERVMHQHPELTAEKALNALRTFAI
jgi:hypothetical protein